MTRETPLRARLGEALDRDRCIQLLRGAVACESITGNEANFAAWLEAVMSEIGLSPKSSFFDEDRPNLIGRRAGAGNGPSLLFAGHTDTVHARGWCERWAGTEREDPFGGAIVGGELWGRGSADMKGGICASLAAMELIDRVGLELDGDVCFAFVGDEESGEPGTGVSAGAKDFAEKANCGALPRPDFAIYLEPTGLDVYTAQMGFFIADVAITGKSSYFGLPERGVDALKAAHAALAAVWEHSKVIAERGDHGLIGKSFALVTEIRGGGYIAVPGECQFSLIRKVRPGENLDQAASELETCICGSLLDWPVKIEFTYPAGRDHKLGGTPAEIDSSLPPVRLLCGAASSSVAGRGRIRGAPYWSEAAILINTVGCPTVYCAPGDISTCHTVEERIELDEYFAAVVAFAEFTANYCGSRNQ